MKDYVLAMFLVILLLIVSLAHARQEKTTPSQSPKIAQVYGELSRAPEKDRAKRNPFEKDPLAPVAGRVLFMQHCAECHGPTAEGGKKGPSLRAPQVQCAEPGAIFWILTNGVVRRGMPVWSRLPEPQRWQLVSYIKSLGEASVSLENALPMPEPVSIMDSSPPPR